MNFVITIAAFILAIGILVTIHELGHYWVARWCDVKILRFSIGFGRPLWLRRRGPDQTEWVIASLPLGGYVKMADERDDSVEEKDRSRAFNNKPVWQRILIVAAGPVANFLLAAIFYWVLLLAGMPGIKPFVAAAPTGSAGAQAGFQEADLITGINGREVRTWTDARLILLDVASAHGVAEVSVLNDRQQTALRRLDLAGVAKEDLDRDFLARVGVRAYYGPSSTTVEIVNKNSPAERAGVLRGDRIISLGGEPIQRWVQFVDITQANAGRALAMEVERAGSRLEMSVTPERTTENGTAVTRVGIAFKFTPLEASILNTIVRYGPLEAIPRAWTMVWDTSIFSIKMMGRMLTGDVSLKNLSGPITIADYAGQSAMLGWISYVNFLALISISLGVLNLLPVPVLDGGQLMYYMAEILKGSPVSDRTMQIGQQVGLTLLLGLTAFAFYNDIHRLLTG
ncbi:MAG: RIP metalloprotease RseP [Betaproteobacteria bacterium]